MYFKEIFSNDGKKNKRFNENLQILHLCKECVKYENCNQKVACKEIYSKNNKLYNYVKKMCKIFKKMSISKKFPKKSQISNVSKKLIKI